MYCRMFLCRITQAKIFISKKHQNGNCFTRHFSYHVTTDVAPRQLSSCLFHPKHTIYMIWKHAWRSYQCLHTIDPNRQDASILLLVFQHRRLAIGDGVDAAQEFGGKFNLSLKSVTDTTFLTADGVILGHSLGTGLILETKSSASLRGTLASTYFFWGMASRPWAYFISC